MMKRALITCFIIISITITQGQEKQERQKLTQTIRGKVLDSETQIPLPGVNIIVTSMETPFGTTTDENGNFRLENIPVGRQSLQISFIGYKTKEIPNLVVTSSKEVILNINLVESVTELEEVVVKANRRKDQPINRMASISARSFTVEETSRYPGSYGDPARMAANYAGVMSVRDNRNDIIIRGNSSTGLLWRLDGIEIPNPNHFAASGTTGGPITILNNNLLSNSDFLTGAFPAEYGNALAGVFDLKMRNGNDEKRESWAQFGYNGLELGTEGPLFKKNNSSYILTYRKSLTNLFNLLGAEVETTDYQDLTFKVTMPLGKDRLNIFGIGGNSYIEMYDSNDPQSEWTYSTWGEDLSNGSEMGVIGVSYLHFINNTSRMKVNYSILGSEVESQIDTFTLANPVPSVWAGEKSSEVKNNLEIHLIKKLNKKNNLDFGIIYDRYTVNFSDSTMEFGTFRKFTDIEDENLDLIRGYTQLKHEFSDNFSIYGGVHAQYLTFNESFSIEPRVGLSYATRSNHRFNFGYGLHSQMQPKMIYFTETPLSDGTTIRTNNHLDFSKSHQFIVGYDYLISTNLRIKLETYYQKLYDIPVSESQPQYSLSNFGAEYFIERVDSLVNEGEGENYGIELTLERFFADRYYFLITASLYESKYRGYDGIERNTAFNGNYAINVLGGYEFPLGKNNAFAIGLRATWAGGRPYVPFDVNETVRQGVEVLDWSRAYEERADDYKRVSLRLVIKRNKPKYDVEIGMDLQYRTGYTSVYERRIDPLTGVITENVQMELYPMANYRIQF